MEFFLDIFHAVELSLSYFISPSKRVFWIYVMSSLMIAFLVVVFQGRKGELKKYLLDKEVWFGKSSWVDYSLWLFNGFVKIFAISPILFYGPYLSFWLSDGLDRYFSVPEFQISSFMIVLLYTFVIVIVSDFVTFLVHYAFHKVPLLWEFHKVHHSATSLNPMTQYRIHPVELLVNNGKGLVVMALVTGVFEFLFRGKVESVTYLGVNVLNFIFMFLGANLRHSHIEFKYLHFLEYVFISPFQHQVHHSNNPKHFNKNMGSKFALWDWLFGTIVHSRDVDELHYGLGHGQDKDYDSFWKNLWKPFVRLFKR